MARSKLSPIGQAFEKRTPIERALRRAAANAILEEVEYVELSGRTDFNDLFIDQLSFPA